MRKVMMLYVYEELMQNDEVHTCLQISSSGFRALASTITASTIAVLF